MRIIIVLRNIAKILDSLAYEQTVVTLLLDVLNK